jgi:hypothetical protein
VPSSFAFLLSPFDFLLFAFCFFPRQWASGSRTKKSGPTPARAAYRRHKGQHAMILAVLDGRFCRFAKVGQSVPNFDEIREFSRLERHYIQMRTDTADFALAAASPLACPTTRDSSLTSDAGPPRTPGGRVKT